MPSKRIPIFYASRLDEGTKSGMIAGSEARHALTVLRLKPGATVSLIWDGAVWSGQIAAPDDGGSVFVALGEMAEACRAAGPRVALLVATPKGRSSDLIVQKATELGVSQVAFFGSGRSVPRIPDAKRGQRRERWERVAREACKQCGRTRSPFVGGPLDFSEAVESLRQFDVSILLDTEGKPLRQVLLRRKPDSVGLIVGPEGGFSGQEIARFKGAGALLSSLSDAVLRTETAAICAAAVAIHCLGRPGL